MIAACSPLGDVIDPKISHNHHYGFLKRSIVWSRGGDCVGPGCTEIVGADVESFRPLNPSYAVDVKQVYFEASPIESEPPARFEAVGSYGLGARRVFWEGRAMVDADRPSFVVEPFGEGPPQYYGRDARHVYCRGGAISDEPAAFHALEKPRYFADEHDVYFFDGGVCKKLDADPKTFEFMRAENGAPSIYARDARHVYLTFGATVISKADPATFRVRCSESMATWAVDATHVFDSGRALDVSPDTFVFPHPCPLPDAH